MTIIEKLVAIQSELKAPKNQRNNFGNYNYRSCEDILEAVKPLLKQQGLALVINDEVVEVGGRIYFKSTARLTDGKESIEASAFAREEESKKGMDSAQISGATSSYSRKYCLNALLCIDDNKDADATNTHDKQTPTQIPVLPTLTQAIYETTLAKSEEGLKAVWNKYPEYQKDEKFKTALKNRKEALNEK